MRAGNVRFDDDDLAWVAITYFRADGHNLPATLVADHPRVLRDRKRSGIDAQIRAAQPNGSHLNDDISGATRRLGTVDNGNLPGLKQRDRLDDGLPQCTDWSVRYTG